MNPLKQTLSQAPFIVMQCPAIRFLRIADVVRKTGLSKSTIHGRVRAGKFPSPISLGNRAVGYLEYEVEGFLQGLVRRARDANPNAGGQLTNAAPSEFMEDNK